FLAESSPARTTPTTTARFWFQETNTRLQVEHPVTELVTGLDLVELQLHVAEGGALPAVPPITGHAIEARLYAEDAANDFLPVTGTLERFAVPDGVRVDTGVHDGSVISPYYDPMIAKVIAHAPTRAAAARKLADALARAQLHGLTTNRDFLVRVLRHPDFLAGEADTGFLERVEGLAAPLVDAEGRRLAAAAAALAGQAARRAEATVLGTLPSGWRNNPSQLQEVVFDAGAEELRVGYRFDRAGRLAVLRVGDEDLDAVLVSCAPDAVELEVGGVRLRFAVRPGAVNTTDGQVDLRELPRFPDAAEDAPAGSLTSPMPGLVVRVLAATGEAVTKGQPLLVLEAMKMEHEIAAPADGALSELRVSEGAQVEAGAVLAVIDEPAP
ncbi:MAG TPA: biotin/lipoyl-containing protein, partial [Solirubrobacteraceae bacterium]